MAIEPLHTKSEGYLVEGYRHNGLENSNHLYKNPQVAG